MAKFALVLPMHSVIPGPSSRCRMSGINDSRQDGHREMARARQREQSAHAGDFRMALPVTEKIFSVEHSGIADVL